MPQFDPATFVPQLFWLMVTFGLLLIAMRRYALPRISDILEARQARITGDLEKASGLQAEADRVMAEYQQTVAETRAQAAAMIKQVSDEMAAASTKRHQAFAAELAQQTKAAEARIATARDEALRGLKVVAVEAAQAATAKLIGIEPKADQVHKAVAHAMQRRA